MLEQASEQLSWKIKLNVIREHLLLYKKIIKKLKIRCKIKSMLLYNMNSFCYCFYEDREREYTCIKHLNELNKFQVYNL